MDAPFLACTHSAHGVEVFRTVQEKVGKEGFRVRQNIKTSDSGQLSLSDELFIELDTSREGVGTPATVGWGTETLLQAVAARPGIAFERLAPDVMEQVPLRTPHLNRIVMDQRKAGLLRFDLPQGKRTPSHETEIWPSDKEGADLGAGRRLARAQEHRHRLAALHMVDVDRQEAAGVVVGVEQRHLLVTVHRIAGVVDV